MSDKYKVYNQDDLEKIAIGATLLASGGGGTYESGRNLSQHFQKSDYYSNPTFNVVDINDLDSDGYGVVVAYIGAPEAIKTVNYPEAAVKAAEHIQVMLQQEGKTLKYVVPVEIGALSSVVPCLVASRMGLSVVDGDGAGRAVPELTMLSFSAEGVSCKPTILANSKDFSVDLSIGEKHSPGEPLDDAAVVEKIVRPVLGLSQFNEIAGLAVWVMNAEQMRNAIKSTGSLGLAKDVGEIVSNHNLDSVIALLRAKGKKVFKLFDGIFDAEGCTSLTAGGFDHGTITISSGKEKFVTVYQNESLIGWRSDASHPLAMAPDSIAFYVEDSQKVYAVADVMDESGKLVKNLIGKNVSVIGIAAEDFLRSKAEKDGLLPVFEGTLRKLGYYGEYREIEKINSY